MYPKPKQNRKEKQVESQANARVPVEQEPRSKVTFYYLFSFLTTFFVLFWGQGMREKNQKEFKYKL